MEKIWLKNYPANVPSKLPPLTKNLIQRFEETCREFSNKSAYISFDKTLSYEELYQKSMHLASFLQAQGFKKGDVIVIQLPNLLQYPISVWASLMAGLTVVNMNPLYTAREMLKPIKETKAKGIILLSNKLTELNQILDQTALQKVLVTEPADLLDFPKKQLINLIFKYKMKTFKQKAFKQKVSFLKALKEGSKSKAQIIQRDLNEICFIQYTGGTTGVSKGACLTQRNILSNLKQCEIWMLSYLKKGDEKALSALPLYHIFAFLVNGLVYFFNGYSNVLIANPRQINSLVKVIKKQKITLGTGVNTLFKALLDNKYFRKLDFSNLKLFISGGMSLQPSVQKNWESLTKSSLIEGYGLTEASPVVCVGRLDKPVEGSVGYPLPSTEIRVVDEEGKSLGSNQEGELEVKGPQVMMGYYNQQAETQLVLNKEGWLKTGDIVRVNEKGLVSIIDRKKDMINISGLKVYPNQVEELLSSFTKVQESAVVGAQREDGSEYIKAFIVKKEDTLTEKELISYCKKNLAPYKIPKEFVFIKEIPKNIIGKALRRLLKDNKKQKNDNANGSGFKTAS
ncbi:MAG: AMP-binding protein [Bdellovibrionaceae bacterium]|nr:AMP-binding protein [Pseudobdellovibrionaceae bacterium]